MQSSHDICVNLGHIYMRQNRVVDAGILYQASLKSLPASPSVAMQSENIVAVSDCLALSHFRHQQYDDAARTLLKALHYNPTKLHDWYNIAYVKEELAVKLCRQNKSASDIAHAIDEMEYAVLIFRSLRDQSLCCGMTQHERFQASKVEDHEKFCLDNIEKAKLHMNRVQFEEQRSQELRAQQQREHLQRLALRNEEKQKDMERKRQARAEQQEVARQKQKEFELLKESWTSAAQASERKGKKKKSKPEFSDAAEDGLDNEGEPALYESDSDGDMEANSKHSNIQSGNGSGLEGDGDNVEDSASPRDIFGSDSEEELFLKSSSSTTAAQKRTSSLRENDSDDDDIDDVDSSSHRPPPVKQRRVVDDDDDDVD
ncbi:VIP6 [Symbiodinium microadriaticum]|nr:VIP6 [Symbiodinium microadriaticum]